MLNLVAREPAFSALREEMVASLREELADKEECWEYLATRTTVGGEERERAIFREKEREEEGTEREMRKNFR